MAKTRVRFSFSKANKLKVLRRMRELIARPYGWRKHSLYGVKILEDGRPSVCLLGAEYIALGDLTGSNNAMTLDSGGEKLSIAEQARKRGFRGVAYFNDHKATKKKDVLAFLDDYIAELEG